MCAQTYVYADHNKQFKGHAEDNQTADPRTTSRRNLFSLPFCSWHAELYTYDHTKEEGRIAAFAARIGKVNFLLRVSPTRHDFECLSQIKITSYPVYFKQPPPPSGRMHFMVLYQTGYSHCSPKTSSIPQCLMLTSQRCKILKWGVMFPKNSGVPQHGRGVILVAVSAHNITELVDSS